MHGKKQQEENLYWRTIWNTNKWENIKMNIREVL